MTQALQAERPAPPAPSVQRRIPWWTLPVAGLFAGLPFITRRVGDPDYFWHVLTGTWIVQHHALPTSELYTYTIPGAPYTDQEYGTQLLFYVLRGIGGLTLVSVFFAAIVWAGFWLLWARIREHEHSPLIAGAALVVGAAAGFAVWGPRPQMFDFTLVSLELLWIERFLAGKSRAIYWLPLVVLVWANVHAGFVFAFFIIGLTLAALVLRWLWERRPRDQLLAIRRLALIGVGSLVASLLTPWGTSLHVYVWKTQFSSQLSSFVREWQSPNFHEAGMLPFAAMLLLVLVGMAWRRPRLLDLVLMLGTLALCLRTWKFIPMFVCVATPVLAWQCGDLWQHVRRRVRVRRFESPPAWLPSGLAALLIAVAVAGTGVGAYTLRGQTRSTADNYPVAAANWLADHPTVGTHMFNEYAFGGYLAYRFHPEQNRRVFIYGETELMGDSLLAEYVDINQVHSNWSRIFDKYGIDYVVFPPQTALVAVLDASPAWHRVYADKVAVILTR